MTRILPLDAHRWELFVTPAEVARLLSGVGLVMAPTSERRGMRPTFRPLAFLRALCAPKRPDDAPRRWHILGPFELCQSDAANWLWAATKPLQA